MIAGFYRTATSFGAALRQRPAIDARNDGTLPATDGHL
jgi:hypothetical protein